MLSSIRPQDIADIIIMSSLVYLLYSWFRNTKALQVVIGLAFLGILYTITKNFGLLMTSWVFQELGTVLFVLIIVIFQTEIRQALYRFSLLSNLFGRQANAAKLDHMDVASQIFALAAKRTGAILVFQRKEPLDEHLLHGVKLDCLVSSELIGTIFHNGTPLHDGATVIRDGRVSQASCHLPLSLSMQLPHYYGTRHRAGLGLSEQSDAAVVIVSEERGEVSVALAGELRRVDTPEQLSEQLFLLLSPQEPEAAAVSVKQRLFSNFWPKLAALLLVIGCWVVITSRQGGIVAVTAPIKFHNLPGNLTLMRSTPEEVEVRLQFFSSLIASPKQLDLVADIDLQKLKEGVNQLPIRSDDITVPLGVKVTELSPATVKVVAERNVRKILRVRLKTVGKMTGPLRLKKIRLEPETVTVEGPEHLMEQFGSVDTEEVGLNDIRTSTVLERKLLAPAPQIRVLQAEPVRVRLTVGRH